MQYDKQMKLPYSGRLSKTNDNDGLTAVRYMDIALCSSGYWGNFSGSQDFHTPKIFITAYDCRIDKMIGLYSIRFLSCHSLRCDTLPVFSLSLSIKQQAHLTSSNPFLEKLKTTGPEVN